MVVIMTRRLTNCGLMITRVIFLRISNDSFQNVQSFHKNVVLFLNNFDSQPNQSILIKLKILGHRVKLISESERKKLI